MSANPPVNPIGTAPTTPVAVIGESWLAGSWWAQLLPGSWRNVPFVMDAAPTKAGRRVAVHEYPYRDTVWSEDLGKLPRRYQIQAFLTGDDCYIQKKRMIAACETAGPGTLVHPTLGMLQVVLLNFSTTDRRDRGRYVEVDLEFIDYAPILFPTLALATANLVTAAATALVNTAATVLSNIITGTPSTTPAPAPSARAGTVTEGLKPVPGPPTQFTQDFAQMAIDAVSDPALSLNAVVGLVGLYGRYSTGNAMTLQPESMTVGSALAAAVTARQNVINLANELIVAGDNLQ